MQVDFASAGGTAGREELAASASAAVCAGAMLAACTASTVPGDGAGGPEAKRAFIGADGSVLVDGAGAVEVLGALEDGMVVDRAGGAVATVADMRTVCSTDLPAETLQKIADRGTSARTRLRGHAGCLIFSTCILSGSRSCKTRDD